MPSPDNELFIRCRVCQRETLNGGDGLCGVCAMHRMIRQTLGIPERLQMIGRSYETAPVDTEIQESKGENECPKLA